MQRMQTLGIYKLRTRTQNYDWGSTSFLASLRGEGPSPEPEAELWVGAHPKGPSDVELAGLAMPLSDLIDARPVEVLGPRVVDRFGDRLPFLLKVLAVEAPLSIQLHPDRVQARRGLDGEVQRQVPELERNYTDPRHKPEIAVALTRFSALRGLRPVPEILELFERGGLEEAKELTDALRESQDEEGLRAFVKSTFRLDGDRAAAILAGAERAASEQTEDPAYHWVGKLLELHLRDIGCLAPLFMNLEVLEPGQAIFQPAGMLHCYLEGAAVEVMADSDNVLRAGLTTKYRDIPELLRMLVVHPFDMHAVEAHQREDDLWSYYPPVEEFSLSRLRFKPGTRYESKGGRSVELWICTEGEGRMWTDGAPFSVDFKGGDALLVPAAIESYNVEGDGTAFFAAVP